MSHLTLNDAYYNNQLIDLPLDVLFSKTPNIQQEALTHQPPVIHPLNRNGIMLTEAINRMLHYLPAVAEKTFIININDRNIVEMVGLGASAGCGLRYNNRQLG